MLAALFCNVHAALVKTHLCKTHFITASLALALGAIFILSQSTFAQVFDEKYDHWPEKLKINGTVVAGSGLDSRTLSAFIPDNESGKRVALFHGKSAVALLKEMDMGQLCAIAEINATLPLRLKELEDNCDTLFLLGVSAGDLTQKMGASLHAIIERGGTIIVEGSPDAVAMTGRLTDAGLGWNLFPDCVVASCFDPASAEERGNLLSILARHPKSVGMGITKGSAVILSGRKVRVFGMGSATLMLMANERQALRVESIVEQRSRQQAPENVLFDLTEWRRDAIDRTLPAFPPAVPQVPRVDNGTLVIVGGGGMPEGLMDQFIELAGGKEAARLVYIPCEERETINGIPGMVKNWERSGVASATFVHTKDRRQANTDGAFLEPLKNATGIWFGGGRQWNFADSYYGTKAHQLMKEVLQKGGVIGGSSAGASIQARYLARATPIGNFRIMAPGYERGGLGFISGVAIDQHFSQRGRQKDMTQLMHRHPQLLGIGIDETTALIVTKSKARVVGAGRVHFYDRNLPLFPNEPDYLALEEGETYDLAARAIVPGQ